MPEIKLKHVVSFSSEDKVYKAENLVKPEGYQKWKCATAGEKNATVILQFEKASEIHSIDIGNEGSAFIEVLVGRSSDSVNDFQVLLVASSFMSPVESRNQTHTNRVRMFGPEKLSQNVKNEKWDCVQIVCTQPFNKNVTYGLSFIKFHSHGERSDESSEPNNAGKTVTKMGAFKLKSDDDDEEYLLKIGSLFGRKKDKSPEEQSYMHKKDTAPSYAASVLAASSSKNVSPKDTNLKRRTDNSDPTRDEPPAKKNSKNISDFIVYKPIDVSMEKKKELPSSPVSSKNPVSYKKPLDVTVEKIDKKSSSPSSSKNTVSNKATTSKKTSEASSKSPLSNKLNKKSLETPSTPSSSKKSTQLIKKQVPFSKLMEKVVFVLSGFVNPLRSQIRDKALEMGAKCKNDWEKSCTHLICAFLNTPKYIQVRGVGGRVVSKEWILDCHKKKSLLPWRDYMLGTYDFDSSEEESEQGVVPTPALQKPLKHSKADPKDSKGPKVNGTKTPSKQKPQPPGLVDDVIQIDSSDIEDEDALQDYIADTDEDSDSGGDTEDEILKVEKKLSKNQKSIESKALNRFPSVEEISERPDIEILPLPDLPNLFKKKHFFLFGEFSGSNYHEVTRYITAYNGVIDDYMGDSVKYVITEESWDKNFEDALEANEDLIFIKPSWIYKCHEAGKFVPYHPFLITPPES